MRNPPVLLRVRREIAVGTRFGAYLLYGAVCGLFIWGAQRWIEHRDWRVLGAVLRIVGGGLIGFAIWWSYVRFIDPDRYLLQLLLQIGCSVGALWAVIWLVFLQPPSTPGSRQGDSRKSA